jgi:hypothetical protein
MRAHPSRALAHVVPVVLGGALLLGVPACGSGPEPQGPASLAGLPRWEGHAREVFDDSIDPAAVGLSMDAPSARADRFLRERAQTAEVVARVRVQTVTVESIGGATTYHLGVQVGAPPLRRATIPDVTFELDVGPTSPSYGVARAFDTRLRGATFIGFLSRFAGDEGEPVIHFHLAADAADVAAAVKEAVALGEISGS